MTDQQRLILARKGFRDWCIKAGIFADGDAVARVIIDAKFYDDNPVRIVIERFGSDRILSVEPPVLQQYDRIEWVNAEKKEA